MKSKFVLVIPPTDAIPFPYPIKFLQSEAKVKNKIKMIMATWLQTENYKDIKQEFFQRRLTRKNLVNITYLRLYILQEERDLIPSKTNLMYLLMKI